MNDHQHRISPRILQEIIDRDQLLDVVKRALDYRKEATQHKLQKLEKEIQNYMVVPGFSHNPGRAPTQRLLDIVMHCWDDNDPLLISLLLIWIESHHEPVSKTLSQ